MKKAQARKIQALLVEKGIRQRVIARECGVTDATVHKVIQAPDEVVSSRVAEANAPKSGQPHAAVFPA